MYHLEGTHSDPPSSNPTLFSALYRNALTRWQARGAAASAAGDAGSQGDRKSVV